MTEPFVIVVTGDRNWTNKEAVRKEFAKLPPNTVIVHGGCRGLDTIAGEVALEFGFSVDVHPAQWDLHGKAAGPIRNQEMLDLKPKRVLAFHPNLTTSKGTKDCVREAMRRDIPVEIFNGQ